MKRLSRNSPVKNCKRQKKNYLKLKRKRETSPVIEKFNHQREHSPSSELKHKRESSPDIKCKRQKLTLPVINYDEIIGDGIVQFKRNGSLFPNTIRGVICGRSNCGKTNVLLAIIEHENGLRFVYIYVYSKSADQPKFNYLKMVIKGVPGVLKPLEGMGYFAFTEHDQVVPPEKVFPFSLMIFDDIQLESQKSCNEFYSRGRHKYVDSFYLCQSYSAVPKQYVRDNVNFLIIFKQDDSNTKHIYKNHVNTDMKFNKFKELCDKCWKDKFGFIVIDKERDINNGRYRKGLHEFFIIN